ncbi:MAG: tetratricopeptide repeat protein [Ignavibacteriaceae bacterium]|nr:tetratricopeptide repeat protein [Ignavibacteriaceae bacterium]
MRIVFFTLLVFGFIGCSSSVKTVQGDESELQQKSYKSDAKRKALDLFLNGTNADAKGDYSSAILEYQEAAQLDPSAGIYYAIAKDYFLLNKLSFALQNITKAVSNEPNNVEYLLLQEEIFSAAKQNVEAVAVLEKIISLDSTNINAYYKLARLYESNKPKQAIEVYKKVTKLIGNEWTVLTRVADLYERLGDNEKAVETLESLSEIDPANKELQKVIVDFYLRTKNYENALLQVDDVLRSYPDDLEAHETKARIFVLQNNWAKASEEYQFILEQKNVPLETKISIGASYFQNSFKDSTLLPIAKKLFTTIDKDTTDWQVKLHLGAIATVEKNDSLATTYYNLVIELAPWHPEGWIRLGGLYFDNKKYTETVKVLSTAITKFPEDFTINLLLGVSFAQLNDHDNAKKYLSKAVELNGNDVNALSAYGYTLSQLKENDKAIFFINKAIKLDPGNVDLLGTLGLIYDGQEAWTQCDSIYSLALKNSPDNALINNNYAYSLSKRAVRLDEALEMVKMAVTAEPKNSSYLDTIGWVYFQLGDYENAKKYIEEALQAGGEKAVILEHFGDVLFKLGQKDEAISTWKKAFELDNTIGGLQLKIERGAL